jgi:hypothetical protein
MARDGGGVYSLPGGSTVTNGDTSDGTDINTPLTDLETDMNTARPVVAGGTGATTASAARTNLGLGNAATETVQASVNDTTADRLLPVGAFGLGDSDSNVVVSQSAPLPAGFFGTDTTFTTAISLPFSAAGFQANWSAARGFQFFGSVSNTHDNRYMARTQVADDTWSSLVEFYTTENLLGTVAESSGTPTGAVIEYGTNANGEYTRWADGTQICTNANSAITTAPAAFVGTITKVDSDKLWVGVWFT